MPSTLETYLPAIIRRNVELGALLLVVLVVGMAWGLAELIDEVLEGSTRDLDRTILLMLRVPGDLSDPVGPPWLEEAGRDLTAVGGTIVIGGAVLFSAGFFAMRREIASMVFLLVSTGGGIALSSLAKEVFDRPRPNLVPYGSIVHTASFPSGHSMMAAVAYLTLGVLIARALPQRRQKIYVLGIAVTLTLLVGVSRVYLGVHWPTDVAAGWLAGAMWAGLCMLAARVLARWGGVEREAATDAG